MSASGFRKTFDEATHLTGSIPDTIQERCPENLHEEEEQMTKWIRIKILATDGTHIWTIITLIRSTTHSAKN